MTARSIGAGLDFEAMFRTAPAAYLILLPDAPDYHIADLNEAYAATTMTRREDLVGQKLFEAFPLNPQDPLANGAVHFRRSLDTVLLTRRTNTIAAQRYDIPGRGGVFERRYWKVESTPLLDVDGSVTYIVQRLEDVTAYRSVADERTRLGWERGRLAHLEAEAQERADAAERRLKAVYQHAPVAMALLGGRNHVFEFANARHLEIIGHSDVLGKPIRDVLPELEGQSVFEELDRVFSTGRASHNSELVVRLSRPGSAPHDVCLNVVFEPLLGADGVTESIAFVASDVSELVRSREEARAAAADRDAERRQLLAVLEQSPLGIAIAEAPSGRLLFVNARVGEIYGRSRLSESIESYSVDWRGYHRDGRQIEPQEWPMARAILQGETIENEVVWIEHSKGHRVEITIKAAPIRNAEGEIIAGVAVLWDVTAERRRERQLREAQRLQAVGTLAGGVAHEVNNQMTVVLGFGEFVLRALDPDQQQAADQRQVLQAADRAARVTQQLLAFSRQQTNQPRVLDLYELALGLRPVLTQLLGSDKELVIVPTRPESRVNADPIHVEQVLINLVANARDAITTGGRVTISVEDVVVEGGGPIDGQRLSMVPGPYVLLTVSDSGTGIDPETISRIFEPFFTTKPVGQGTGLGLSMVYGIVKQHRGYIWAHSQPGRGTAMRLYWPAVRPEAAAATSEGDTLTRPTSLPKAARVIVVEDEDSVRQLTVRTLASAGWTVTEAKDGPEALRLLHEATAPLDMLLTDVVMPYLSGRQLSEMAAELYPGLPVLFISGYAGNEVILKRLIPEGAAFLQKPFTPEELIRAASEVLASRVASKAG
jgi:PAS domain S-box-containing protein